MGPALLDLSHDLERSKTAPSHDSPSRLEEIRVAVSEASHHAFLAGCITAWCFIITSAASFLFLFLGFILLGGGPQYMLATRAGTAAIATGEAILSAVLASVAVALHIRLENTQISSDTTELGPPRETGVGAELALKITLASIVGGSIGPAVGVAVTSVEGVRAIETLAQGTVGMAAVFAVLGAPLFFMFLANEIGCDSCVC